MKNMKITPDWRGASVERYDGPNRRDTRRVRTKIFNYCNSHGFGYSKDKPREYLPFGLCNSWIHDGCTFTPVWVRTIPLDYYGPDFAILVHRGTMLLGWYVCYERKSGITKPYKLPSGQIFYAIWRDKNDDWNLSPRNFYRPYEEPTKDLEDFDVWRAENCPGCIARQIARQAKEEWVHGVGTARYAYEAGERAYKMEVLKETARRYTLAREIARESQSAQESQRQLRALGFMA